MKRRIDKKYIWIPVCAMVIAVLSVCFFQYRIVQKAEEQAFDVLRDSAKEQRTILQTKIEGQYSITKAFASSLGTAAQMSSEDLLLRMNAVKESAGFTHIAVVGPDGTAYYGNGKRTDLSEKAFFATAMGGKDVLARDGTCLLGGDEGEFIMAVPVINGEEVRGVLVSHYKGEGFVKLLVSEAYGRRSFSFVSDSTGMVIIDNNKEGLSLEGENLLEEKYIDELNVSEKALSESLEIGSRGVFKATFGGVESYCIYEPLMINDWTIFNVVSEQVVKEKTSWFLNMAIGLCIIIFIASGIIL
ncbi:MAG: cache domain-containing protein, partial [Anaerovoracaceae bacterium]